MGTSQSSKGAPSGVALVPPWVPDPGQAAPAQPLEKGGASTPPPAVAPMAPAGRFAPARRSLGKFASSGSGYSMRAGVGHYFARGLGGGVGGGGGGGSGGSAAARFGGTASTAERLGSALSGLASGRTRGPDVVVDPSVVEGRDADEVLRTIVEAVRPIDGTQDAEASREAIGQALAEVLKEHPKADLRNLTDEQRQLAVQEYVARDMFHRLVLDVGGAIKAHAATAKVYLKRLDQIRAYMRQTVAAAFRRLTAKPGAKVTRSQVSDLTRRAIADAISVFEGFIQ